MAARSAKKDDPSPTLKQETVENVIAILFILVAILLILASMDKAGPVGEKLFWFFHDYLFGIGYYLLPFILIILSITFLRSIKQSLTAVRIVATALFMLSALGLIALISPNQGGLVGGLISSPLVFLFDSIATALVLSGVIVISLVVVLDTPLPVPTFKALWARFMALLTKKDDSADAVKEMKIIGDIEETAEDRAAQKARDEERKRILAAAEADDDDAPAPAPVAAAAAKKISEDEVSDFTPAAPLSLEPYNPPALSLLERDSGKPAAGDIKANANIIKRTLQNFGINVEMDEISIGPTVTRYALKPAEGVKLSRIIGLQNDLALALAAHPLRIEAPIPGKSLVGIEIPNSKKTTVGLGTLLSSPDFSNSDKPLTVGLGKGISGSIHFANIAKAPHLLVAGTTGSGKSVTIHTIITSLLYRNSPQALKFIMVDPKRVELTLYNKIPHLLTPVITDPKKAVLSLKWAAKEMDRRYDLLQKHSARDIQSYHKNILGPAIEAARKAGKDEIEGDATPDPMPYIVVVIDELADIMQTYPKELEAGIVRLAQMSRAVGIHLILSTQRPSVNVITGLIKANIPSRIALQVSSQIDSRTILDQTGAEKLLGAGDMLYLSGDMSTPIRIQSAYITETEVKNVVSYLAREYSNAVPSEINLTGNDAPNALFDSLGGGALDSDEESDDLYEEAKNIVVQAGKASTSYLQRRLRVGYARAARLMDILEDRGVISAGDGAKPRDVLIGRDGGAPSGNPDDESFA